MNYIFKRISSKISFSNLVEVAKNPKSVVEFIRGIRAERTKRKMDMEREIRELPVRLSKLFNAKLNKVKGYHEEIKNNKQFYQEYDSKLNNLRKEGLIKGTTSIIDCQTLYVVTRIIKPEVVVETGVMYGAFDAHITEALSKNERGRIVSIDLPGGPKKYDYGYLVSDKHKKIWNIEIGNSLNILEDVLDSFGGIGLFLHDSLHTKDHMRKEDEISYPYIRRGGVLASHDILKSDVFQEFCEEKSVKYKTVRNIGVGLK